METYCLPLSPRVHLTNWCHNDCMTNLEYIKERIEFKIKIRQLSVSALRTKEIIIAISSMITKLGKIYRI